MKEFEVSSIEDLNEVASAIIELTSQNKIFLLDGEMGAGKTTLTSEVCKKMEVEDEPSSPTFSIVNTYYSPKYGEINHFDFYRLKDEQEAIESGLEEQLYSGNICFVEWGEKIHNLLPDNYVRVAIEMKNTNHRKITISQ